MGWCSKFGDLEVDQGRERFVRGGNTALFGWCMGKIAREGRSLTVGDLPETRPHPEGERNKRLPGKVGEIREEAYPAR